MVNAEQSRILKDKTIDMSFEDAKGIFEAKNYEDPPMRGRNSMAPLRKLGLVYFSGEGKDKTVAITESKSTAPQEEHLSIYFPLWLMSCWLDLLIVLKA